MWRFFPILRKLKTCGMKRLSLFNLSGQALDKFQRSAVTGGGLSSCVCAHICAGCPCRGNDVEDTAEATLDPEY